MIILGINAYHGDSAACLVADGKLRVDDRVTRFFHNFGVYGKTHITFRHLLAHCSGLPAWRPYYKEILQCERKGGKVNFLASDGAKKFVYQQINRERLEAPPGTATLYSDLGFMLLGAVVEEVAGVGLGRFCRDRIFRPLGLRTTAFVDLSLLRTRRFEPIASMIAPTERCPWRKRVLCGEVHDDNCAAFGGVAGHAGMFGTARAVRAFGCAWVSAWHGRRGALDEEAIRFATAERPGGTHRLGWDGKAKSGSAAGSRMGPRSFGHLGFTGTSLWCDPDRQLVVVLLTNRVAVSDDNAAIRAFRPAFHDAVVGALEG